MLLVKYYSKYGSKLTFGSSEAAGCDVSASEEALLRPGEYKKISTGIYLDFPSGYECQVRPRSGLATKFGVTILNSPGTVDSDFRGEIQILLINHGNLSFKVNVGDRIAQLVFSKLEKVEFKAIKKDELSVTERNERGWGSTGF